MASAVARGSTLHPPLRQSLLETADQAVDSRRRLAEAVGTELEAIETTESELADLAVELESLHRQPIAEMEFNALRLTRERLETLRERCDDLVSGRQRRIRYRREYPLSDVGVLEEYFYGGAHTYPILAAIGRFGTVLERTRRYVDQWLVEVR